MAQILYRQTRGPNDCVKLALLVELAVEYLPFLEWRAFKDDL